MSIFKETLDPGIQTQLQARTLVVNGINNNRSGLLPWYLSKNAWVRMTSFVNFTEGTLYLDGTGSIKVNPVKGYYKGNELSKKYILQGGTLYTSESGDQTLSSLRYGVATGNAVYGSNIDARPSGKADPNYFRQLGIRPMPGITDVRMRTIGAYGSLFETTVNFHAWDTNQLNELEILFMRPGYSVLLEWGWSQYLNYNESLTGSMSTLTEDQLESQIFSGQTINPFNNSLVPESVYEELERLRKKHRYNYDGMLGYVKNFNWKLRRDGGYDCSTTLISMGEVINTIKMNTSANQTIAGQDKLPSDDEVSSYVYDDYENVLLSLKSEVEATTQGALQQNGVTISSVNTYVSESGFFGKWEKNINYISIDKIKETLKLNKYNAQADYLGTELSKNPFYQYIENTSDTNYGTRYEYLTLDVVVAIIASYCNVKARNIGETQEKKQSSPKDYPFVKILVPTDNDFCLAGKDTISVQPSICNVYNPGAFSEEIKYFTFPGGAARTNGKPIYDPKRDGVVPTIHSFKKPFYDKTIKAGRTNRILVNIDFLLSVYRDLKSSPNESGVLMTDYLKNILNKISNALGGLNNFILSTAGRDQNTLRIIDTYYFGQEKKDSTYQFDLLGLGSICKDVSIQSQIFQEQSTIVAIAAQSKANLADVYNSTQIYLNAGLEDRLAVAKWQGSEIDTRTEDVNDPFYIKLAQLMVYARSYLIGYTTQRDTKGTVKVADSGEDPHTLLKQALLRYDGEMNFKALIPFKLRITLEGIGGIVVGQIFTVKQNILPKNYYDKKLGFVITQIEHVLKNNQWETVLDTQICILDQQSFYDNNGDSLLTLGIQRKGFGEALLRRQILGLIWPVLIDFMIYQATRSYIGYIYASFEDQRGNFINLNFLDSTYDKGDVDEYWLNNASLFINRATATGGVSLNIHQSPLTSQTPTIYSTENFDIYHANGMGFEGFLRKWFKIWTLQNPDKLNIQYSQNKTLGQVVEFVTGQNYLLNPTDVEYQNFKTYLDEAKRFVDGFNPNALVATAGSPIYDPPGDNISKNEIQQVIAINQNPEGYYRAPSGTRYYEVLGWKWKTLVERIEDLILSFQSDKLSTIKTNYNSPLVFSLKNYFVPNSSVMYNESNSMTGIKNVNVDKNGVKGDILDIFSFKGDGSESKVKDQYWANSILWTSDYIEINPTTNQQTQKTITANDGTVAKSIFSKDPASSGLSIGNQNNKFWQIQRDNN